MTGIRPKDAPLYTSILSGLEKLMIDKEGFSHPYSILIATVIAYIQNELNPLSIKDEGTLVTDTPLELNFVGTGVQVTQTEGKVIISIPRNDITGNTGLTGAINGVNKVFTTLYPFKSESTILFVNGQKQKLGVDYNETDINEITFVDAPKNTEFIDTLEILYTIA